LYIRSLAAEVRGKVGRVSKLLLLVWFILGSIFWQLDTTRESMQPYDFVSMNLLAVPHLAVFCGLVFFAMYFDRSSLLCVLLLALYNPMILIANYPRLMFRDTYLHASPTKSILALGRIDFNRDPTYEYWPTFFFLWAMISEVTGLDLISVNYIPFLFLVLSLGLITWLFSKEVARKGYSTAWLIGPTFLAFFCNNQFNYLNFARSSATLTLMFYFLFNLMKPAKLSRKLTLLILVAFIVTAHPHQALYLVVVTLVYSIIAWIFRKQKRDIVLFFTYTIVLFFSWWLFNAGPSVSTAIGWLSDIFSPKFWVPIQEALTKLSFEPYPTWANLLRTYFKLAFIAFTSIGLLAFLAFLVLRLSKRHVPSNMAVFVIAALLSSTSMLGAFYFMPRWSAGRLTAFLALPAAFSPVVLLAELIPKGWMHNSRSKVLLLLLFTISIFFTSMVIRFEANVYFEYSDHSPEHFALAFTSFSRPTANLSSGRIITMSFYTALYYWYYDYRCQDRIWYYFDYWISPTPNLTRAMQTIDASDLALRGWRDNYETYKVLWDNNTSTAFWKTLDVHLQASMFDRTYSNGFFSLYSHATLGTVESKSQECMP
jgi:hypothetical protein